jgi:hypothetical protein
MVALSKAASLLVLTVAAPLCTMAQNLAPNPSADWNRSSALAPV